MNFQRAGTTEPSNNAVTIIAAVVVCVVILAFLLLFIIAGLCVARWKLKKPITLTQQDHDPVYETLNANVDSHFIMTTSSAYGNTQTHPTRDSPPELPDAMTVNSAYNVSSSGVPDATTVNSAYNIVSPDAETANNAECGYLKVIS